MQRSPLQTRSMVIRSSGSWPPVRRWRRKAGALVLEHGGTRSTPPFAANATLGVVQPGSNGIGRDLFAIVYEANQASCTA